MWEGHPNCIEPGKRPRITLTPTLVIKDGKAVLAMSVAGGDAQDQAMVQMLTNYMIMGWRWRSWCGRRGIRRIIGWGRLGRRRRCWGG
ncbi:MAG: gamma-glutamyltransferase [Planctomycetota bacterium]|nr:gamma-glutamyltransferase [Planctomycetota bacterium]